LNTGGGQGKKEEKPNQLLGQKAADPRLFKLPQGICAGKAQKWFLGGGFVVRTGVK